MIKVPQSTIEKPLTVIDFIAALESCSSIAEVAQYGQHMTLKVRQDERFTRAVAKRLLAIKGRKAAA